MALGGQAVVVALAFAAAVALLLWLVPIFVSAVFTWVALVLHWIIDTVIHGECALGADVDWPTFTPPGGGGRGGGGGGGHDRINDCVGEAAIGFALGAAMDIIGGQVSEPVDDVVGAAVDCVDGVRDSGKKDDDSACYMAIGPTGPGGTGGGERRPKVPMSGARGGKDSTGRPSWLGQLRKNVPWENESGKDYAKRMMHAWYGEGNWSMDNANQRKGFNQIKKYGDRHVENPPMLPGQRLEGAGDARRPIE